MGDEDPETRRRGAVKQLAEKRGSVYMTNEYCYGYLRPFGGLVEREFIADRMATIDGPDAVPDDNPDYGLLALSNALEDVQQSGKEVASPVSVSPHEMVATVDDVTEILVEALGGDASNATMLGHGSTADVRHEENIEWIADHIGVEIDA